MREFLSPDKDPVGFQAIQPVYAKKTSSEHGEEKNNKHAGVFALSSQWKISIHYSRRNICTVQQTSKEQ